jgi:hypothetical protein
LAITHMCAILSCSLVKPSLGVVRSCPSIDAHCPRGCYQISYMYICLRQIGSWYILYRQPTSSGLSAAWFDLPPILSQPRIQWENLRTACSGTLVLSNLSS